MRVSSCATWIEPLHLSFLNGGLLFSSITIVFIAVVSLYSFLLLIQTKFVVSGSFGGKYAGLRFTLVC
jgi:hypothetical protein